MIIDNPTDVPTMFNSPKEPNHRFATVPAGRRIFLPVCARTLANDVLTVLISRNVPSALAVSDAEPNLPREEIVVQLISFFCRLENCPNMREKDVTPLTFSSVFDTDFKCRLETG